MQKSSAFLIPVIMLATQGWLSAVPASDAERAGSIERMLPENPTGTIPVISDRGAWERFSADRSAADTLREAGKLAAQPAEIPSGDLYLEFSRVGNRTRYEAVAGRLFSRISTLTLAECLRDKGDFIAPLEQAIAAVCSMKSWVLPAHDKSLANFNGTGVTIDLLSSRTAWNLALADHLLGERLSSQTRAMIRREAGRRVLDPYEKSLPDGGRGNFWITADHNWNAVCHAGVIGTALILEPDRARRARFVAAAEKNMRFFLSGFSADGYCSEGLGYWNYGFGHFILLTETLRQATGGKLDLFALDGVRRPALQPAEMEMVRGVYPAFADCSVGARPDPRLLAYINSRFGSGAVQDAAPEFVSGLILADTLIHAFADSWRGARLPGPGRAHDASSLRGWFPDAGILVCRPAQGVAGNFGVALKGGHNAEHHNHNDLGSYSVVAGGRPVLLDPGSEVYTARTFSGKRYESKVLNSYGHPVPVVAGCLQRAGRAATARVLETRFTPEADTLVLDLASAYQVSGLRRMERSFRYDRAGAGSLTVTDTVGFASPASFETALVTIGDCVEQKTGELLIRDGGSAVRVRIDTGGLPFTIRHERIDEDVRMRARPLRIGIALNEPVEDAAIRVSIVPVSAAEMK